MSGLSRYQQQQKGKGGGGTTRVQGMVERISGPGRRSSVEQMQSRLDGDVIDAKFGFTRFKEGSPRLGWLLNYLATTMPDETGLEKSALDLYFIDREGGNFKASVFYEPYFYLDIRDPRHGMELAQHLSKRFEGCQTEIVAMEDLDMPNHLSGKKHSFLKLSFGTMNELMDAKTVLRPIVAANRKRIETEDYHESGSTPGENLALDPLAVIIDLREFDVPYTMRVAIDLDLRVGAWYDVCPLQGSEACTLIWQKELLELCEPRVLAFDIECEKAPLKFPNAESDRCFMVSYMVKNQGYLVINREVVSEDILDFEYTPLAKYPGPFKIFNEADEHSMLKKFISHVQELKPHVIVTYNGDFFDWPYVEKRCKRYGLSIYNELGIRCHASPSPSAVVPKTAGGGSEHAGTARGSTEAVGGAGGEYLGRCMVHLDAFCWVQRDSYLPQGNQGLKAVTKAKLGYDPVEVDPEDMVRYAKERPAHMASYSVSDAVATFYLYTTYVHNFIFSMSTIIPMCSEDVLRKGSGTLCEALLMVEAHRCNIVCPNKQVDPLEKFYNGHLLESETYIGGHVECLEAGVFRADISTQFTLVPSALQSLIDRIDRDLTFAIEVEHGLQRSDVVNYEEIKQEIVQALEMLRDSPRREEPPRIYHLDVGAMYPNIILTNRLQPSAIVSSSECAACEFNRAENNCKRPMTWSWRGDYSPATMSDFRAIQRQLAYDKPSALVGTNGVSSGKLFSELPEKEQARLSKNRLKAFAQKAYHKTKVTTIEERVDTVCMRENSFYVDTVRAFRDRRYDYKLLTKTWKGKKMEAEKKGDAVAKKAAEDKEVLMDSLQLAHKCILNSFYGYVMRKGARWRSMEMAGIVTHTGANLIMQARELVEQVGRPLELDTDGIWCILPSSFPQDFKFRTRDGGKVGLQYPCAMLNADVADRYTNHQYQNLETSLTGSESGLKRYGTKSECSIFFELDGPYKAMVLPASPEEGKLLKKKYAVFNFDGTLAELKGFELKRRGELELVKIFQSQVFEHFLRGSTLQECYDSVGAIGNQWLDVLDSKGVAMDDTELLELISEKKTISKTVDDYEGRKATSLTTALRLADFLGAEMVKDKGLNCNLIISRLPSGAPVTERAIPVAIFAADIAVKEFYLRKWLKDPQLDCTDFRDVVDWNYYKERLGKSIQKIITIPAGLQRIANPCERVEHPPWLQRTLHEAISGQKQQKITSIFKKKIFEGSDMRSAGLIAGRAKDRQATEVTSADIVYGKGTGGARLANEQRRGDGTEISDIEDTGGFKKKALSGIPVVHSRNKAPTETHDDATTDMEHSDVNVYPMLVAKPQSDDELRLWLQHRKEQWSKLKRARHAQQEWSADGSMGFPGAKRAVGVAAMVRNATLSAEKTIWQIFEIQETDMAGIFIVWAMTGRNQLQRLYIVIPRLLYVNCTGSNAKAVAESMGGKPVKRDLPHARPSINLYEVSLSEQKFLRNEKALGMFLCDPQVEGVYGSKTPLLFRAVLHLGCMARVVKIETGAGSVNKPIKLNDIQSVPRTPLPYLDPKVAIFKRIFIYHAVDKNRQNTQGILGLFIVEGNNAEEVGTAENGQRAPKTRAHVWLSQSVGVGGKPPISAIFRQMCPEAQDSCKFITTVTTTVLDAMAQCNDKLADYLRDKKGPTVVIVQGVGSIVDAKHWRKKFSLLQEFPLVMMPSNTQDGEFPALLWQNRISRIMIKRFLFFPAWFEDRLRSARFAQIPVGNLGLDAMMSMIDVAFSRQLEHNKHVLWAANGPLPDLGGLESDEVSVWSDSLKEPQISEPGVYRNICVELEIFGLAVAAIMGSSLLDAQGLTTLSVQQQSGGLALSGGLAENAVFEGMSSSNISHDASCARSFALLKALVAKWIHDVGVSADPHADAILQAIYRFLCGHNGQSLLYDPALHRVVYDLMGRLFLKFIGEFKRLGVKVVYADFYKMVIHTDKYDVSSAHEYLQFIVAAVTNKELFRFLQVNTKRVWEQLVWLSPVNYSGIPISMTGVGIVDIGGSNHPFEEVDEQIVKNQHILVDGTQNPIFPVHETSTDAVGGELDYAEEDEYDFLDDINREVDESNRKLQHRDHGLSDSDEEQDEGHRSIRPDFEFTADVSPRSSTADSVVSLHNSLHRNVVGHWNIGEYLVPAAHIYMLHIIEKFLCLYRDKWDELAASRNVDLSHEEIRAAVEEYMRMLVAERLSVRLIRIVEELQEVELGDGDIARFASSTMNNTYRKEKAETALGFIKVITKILSLDPTISNEVASLRRTLLTQIGVREFNSESEYNDPSLSYVLTDVVCAYCNTSRDMDMLRDPTVGNTAQAPSPFNVSSLQCNSCNNEYDRDLLERRLIVDAEKANTQFVLQDFRCSKTHIVSSRLCATSSVHCAPLAMDISADFVRNKLSVLLKLARFHKFEWLEEVIGNLLDE